MDHAMTEISQTDQSALIVKSEAASQNAARSVIDQAKRFKTSVVVWKNGAVCEIPYEQLDSITLDSKHASLPFVSE
jgi:hypothetical protein